MSFRRILLFLVTVVACLLYFPFQETQAGDEWLPIDPADLKMTSEPKAPGAPAIYLYRQVDRKDLGRANTEYNYVRIKILTEEGRETANITNFGSCHSKTVTEGNVLRYTRTYEIKQLSVPVSQAEDLKKFYRIIGNDERGTAVLKPAAH